MSEREAFEAGWVAAVAAAAEAIRGFAERPGKGMSGTNRNYLYRARDAVLALRPPATPAEGREVCGIEFTPFGLPAQSFIKAARCTLPVGHLGGHKWTASLNPTGPPTTLDATPPAPSDRLTRALAGAAGRAAVPHDARCRSFRGDECNCRRWRR